MYYWAEVARCYRYHSPRSMIPGIPADIPVSLISIPVFLSIPRYRSTPYYRIIFCNARVADEKELKIGDASREKTRKNVLCITYGYEGSARGLRSCPSSQFALFLTQDKGTAPIYKPAQYQSICIIPVFQTVTFGVSRARCICEHVLSLSSAEMSGTRGGTALYPSTIVSFCIRRKTEWRCELRAIYPENW